MAPSRPRQPPRRRGSTRRLLLPLLLGLIAGTALLALVLPAALGAPEEAAPAGAASPAPAPDTRASEPAAPVPGSDPAAPAPAAAVSGEAAPAAEAEKDAGGGAEADDSPAAAPGNATSWGKKAPPPGPVFQNVSLSGPAPPARPPPGTDLVVTALVAPFPGDPQPLAEGSVVLSYVVGLGGQEAEVAATYAGDGPDGARSFTATIPAAAFAAGDLVRFRVCAKDAAGREGCHPPLPPLPAQPGAKVPRRPRYDGAVIALPQGEEVTAEVPILEWFTPDLAAATTTQGSPEGNVLYYNGRLYDNVGVRRRGTTALTWPKPKLKFDLPQQTFIFDEAYPPVEEFGLQSFWYELGERSYMKETLALEFFKAAGVIAPTSFHLHMRANGRFYGLFAFVELLDNDYLRRHGLPSSGPLFKSMSGELSNLRWDVPVKEMRFYWEKENRGSQEGDWALLSNFTQGLAGGGPEPRSRLIFDVINLPSTINNWAAQALVNNLDRCTKNFYMYLNPDTQEWYMLPWDMDGSFGQDNGLGGKPVLTSYCVLACEQWNSPLYCDSEHPQDLVTSSPWGTITVTATSPVYAGPAVRGGRRSRQLLQDADSSSSGGGSSYATRSRRRAEQAAAAATANASPVYAAGPNITTFPKPRGWDNPDQVLVGSASVNGAPGTFNYMYDAVLDVNATRAMYLRRLRTLADTYLASGRLAEMATTMYNRIKPLADKDAATWNSGISIDKGYKQITTEFLPIRRDQLLGYLYGPNGTRPLLPTPQPDQLSVSVVRLVGTPSSPSPSPDGPSFVELRNPHPFAVDVSGWQLTGAAAFTFPPGSVLPPDASSYVTSDVVAFRGRPQAPSGGQGLLALDGLQGGQGGRGRCSW